MRKLIAFVLIVTFITASGAFAISTNEPLKKLSKGLDNVVYGSVETPDNINGTKSKGQVAFKDCTDDTKSDVGRAITRVIGGLWEIATFWYPTD